MTRLKKLLRRAVVCVFRMVPTKLVQHLLLLLRTDRQTTDKWNVHIRGMHFYDPIPDFREITRDKLLRRRVPSAIDFDVAQQGEFLRCLAQRFEPEVAGLVDEGNPQAFDFNNPYFAGLDAAVYYALIRDKKPKRVVEIGAGYSTRIANAALQCNRGEGYAGELVCIEPYPEPRLTSARLKMRLIEQRVEQLDPEVFDEIESGDILFIDSSHSVKYNSDVCFLFFEVLPRLPSGVWIHVHDIFFPYDYPPEWLLDQRLAFNEQYLLEAFLSFNEKFSVLASNYWLTIDEPDAVRSIVGNTRWARSGYHGCSSFWMQKIS